MGNYLNPGNIGFTEIRNDVYMDKTGLIGLINQTIDTPRRFTCISRPRRFGKSFAAKMLCAYFDKTCDSTKLFADLSIANADLVYLPKKNSMLPILVVELKWNQLAKGAIEQIREKQYPEILKGYGADILLVGISYNREDRAGKRKHQCKIEKYSGTQ